MSVTNERSKVLLAVLATAVVSLGASLIAYPTRSEVVDLARANSPYTEDRKWIEGRLDSLDRQMVELRSMLAESLKSRK